MKWQNLKSMKCPKCDNTLKESVGDAYFCPKLSDTSCGFSIGKEKFDKVVSDLYKPKQKRATFEENMSALNNLDRKEVTEDFSDSPYLDY